MVSSISVYVGEAAAPLGDGAPGLQPPAAARRHHTGAAAGQPRHGEPLTHRDAHVQTLTHTNSPTKTHTPGVTCMEHAEGENVFQVSFLCAALVIPLSPGLT